MLLVYKEWKPGSNWRFTEILLKDMMIVDLKPRGNNICQKNA
jgi:hypothetical protein